MTYPPALTDRMEQDMAALSPQRYLRSGYSYKQFTAEFSRLIARARKDRAELKAAGFDLEQLVYYEALLDALCLAQAARRTADSAFAATKRQFAEAVPDAKRRYRYLSAVARYILFRDTTPELHRAYADTRKGRSVLDTLSHTLTLISLIRRRPDLAAEIHPSGVVVDEPHLSETESAALALVRLNGDAKVAANLVSEAVDRRARLMTLCIHAVRELKLFAKTALLDDPDRYRKEWATPAPRRAVSKETISPAPTSVG